MRTAPTLGELALKARLLDARALDEALNYQRQNYLQGDFRRLGELIVDFTRCKRGAIRQLLRRQGVSVVACTLCKARYNALMFAGHEPCLRCGRSLRLTEEDEPLTVEDTISSGSPQADALLREYRQRNPRIGRYEVLGELGRGAMGVIYKGWETKLQRHVALKFLRPYDDLTDEDRQRFEREARAVASLRHENIVQAHAIEEAGGLLYMAMDFAQGVPLDVLAQQGSLKPRQVVHIGAQIARALHYAHGEGIVHRDVKPANVVVDRRGRPYLLDFGIAKKLGTDSVSLTTEGEVLGSLAYMAPEYVMKGAAVLDRRCDVYGLGVVMYEAISAGKLPYGDPDDEMMLMRVVKEEPIPFVQAFPGAPPDLCAIIDRAISRDRAVRHDSALELAEELEGYLSGTSASSGTLRAEAPPAAAPPQPRTAPAPTQPQQAVEEASAGSSGSSLLPWVLVALLALVSAGLGAGWFVSREEQSLLEQAWRRRTGEAELRAAEALVRAGDPVAAEEAFTRAAQLLPDRPEPLEGRARLRVQREDMQGAADDREAAAALRAAGGSSQGPR